MKGEDGKSTEVSNIPLLVSEPITIVENTVLKETKSEYHIFPCKTAAALLLPLIMLLCINEAGRWYMMCAPVEYEALVITLVYLRTQPYTLKYVLTFSLQLYFA